MTRSLVKRAGQLLKDVLRRPPNYIYGVVTSTNPNGNGDSIEVSVLSDDGLPYTRVISAFNLSQGTRVQMREEGVKGSATHSIVRPVSYALQQPRTNPNELVETPQVAFVRSYLSFLAGGSTVSSVAVVLWQIQAQWKRGQPVAYEMEFRDTNGANPTAIVTVGAQAQLALRLKVDTTDDETAFTVEPIDSLVYAPTTTFAERFGIIETENEIVEYDVYDTAASAFTGLLRGQDTQDGVPTIAAPHLAGTLILGRSVTLVVQGIVPDVSYQYRVCGLIGNRRSNWSEWATYVPPPDTVAPSYPSPITPSSTISRTGSQVSWTRATVDAGDIAGYDIQIADNDAFTGAITKTLPNVDTYDLNLEAGQIRYVRTRPYDTTGNRDAWSNTGRATGARIVVEGAAYPNKVVNGDFPDMASLASWTATPMITLDFDATRGVKGLGSGQVLLVRTGSGGVDDIRQTITGLQAGQVLVAQCYVARLANFNQPLDQVRLTIETGIATYDSPIAKNTTLDIIDTGRWTLLEVTGTVPTGATSADIILNIESSLSPAGLTIVWVDDIQLYILGTRSM